MKQLFFLCLVLVCFSSFGAFELFDKSPVQGNLREGAELVPAGGQDGSGALKISGGDKAAQYGYSYRWEKAESGQQYGISFAYLPADNFLEAQWSL